MANYTHEFFKLLLLLYSYRRKIVLYQWLLLLKHFVLICPKRLPTHHLTLIMEMRPLPPFFYFLFLNLDFFKLTFFNQQQQQQQHICNMKAAFFFLFCCLLISVNVILARPFGTYKSNWRANDEVRDIVRIVHKPTHRTGDDDDFYSFRAQKIAKMDDYLKRRNWRENIQTRNVLF